MAKSGRTFSGKKAVRILLVLALAAVAVFLVRGCAGQEEKLSTPKGRERYVLALGWEIDPASEEHKTVRIPEELNGVLRRYNELQLEQGCDLTEHLGERCEQYSYTVTNYPDPGQTVQITLYLQGDTLIAGDVHSTALDGFMQGLKRAENEE